MGVKLIRSTPKSEFRTTAFNKYTPKKSSLKEADIKLLNSAASGNLEGVIAAIKGGANVNARDENGRTPLILAVIYVHGNIIDELLKHPKLDIYTVDNYGKSALDYSKENRYWGAEEKIKGRMHALSKGSES